MKLSSLESVCISINLNIIIMKIETLQETSLIDLKEKFKKEAGSLTAIICVIASKQLAEQFKKKFNPNARIANLYFTPILSTDHNLITLSMSIDDINY